MNRQPPKAYVFDMDGTLVDGHGRDAIKARDPDRLVLGRDSYPFDGYNMPGTSDLASGPATV